MRAELRDGDEVFSVTLLDRPGATHAVLFAVGAGGDPERQHGPLLEALAARGGAVVAPHFSRLSPAPSADELATRARRLRLALDLVARPGLSVAGVGHSIGAMLLLALAGGRAWQREGSPLALGRDARLGRLALLAPAAGYFLAPGALADVNLPILLWTASGDVITPAAQARQALAGLGAGASLDARQLEGGGHFSFLHTLPPGVADPQADRDGLLAELSAELCAFVGA